MAIWDKIFGKKDEKPRAPAGPARAGAPTPSASADSAQEQKTQASAGEKHGAGADILLAPHTTEKTADGASSGRYVFKVATVANKRRVASAVALRYGVAVARVRMTVQPAKERRRGRRIGWKQGFKKAIVQLKEGQTIETL